MEKRKEKKEFAYAYPVRPEDFEYVSATMTLCVHPFTVGAAPDGGRVIRTDADPDVFARLYGRAMCFAEDERAGFAYSHMTATEARSAVFSGAFRAYVLGDEEATALVLSEDPPAPRPI